MIRLTNNAAIKKFNWKLSRERKHCINAVYDGAGCYCRQVIDTSGWHTFYRTECYGNGRGLCRFPYYEPSSNYLDILFAQIEDMDYRKLADICDHMRYNHCPYPKIRLKQAVFSIIGRMIDIESM